MQKAYSDDQSKTTTTPGVFNVEACHFRGFAEPPQQSDTIQYTTVAFTNHASRMPRKQRASKGLTPRVTKSQRKELLVSERARITSLVEDAGWSKTQVAKHLDLNPGTVGKTARCAVANAKENWKPLSDISNYQDAGRSGQPCKLTDQQCDEICEWITSCKEHCDMQAWEIIAKLQLNISDSLLFQLMYD